MDFNLTVEQKRLQKTVKDYAEKNIAPYVDQWEDEGIFSRENFRALAQLGFAGIFIPRELGGSGLSVFDNALIVEQLARVMRAMNYLSIHNLTTRLIWKSGTEEHHRKFVAPLACGEKLCTICITEPDAGSDVAGITTVAERDGDFYVLNGTKAFVTSAGEAEVYAVLCKTNKKPEKKYQGMSFILVEKGTPGFKVMPPKKKLGLNSVPVAWITLENTRVPAANLIGEENRGFYLAAEGVNYGRLNVAAESTGGAQASLDIALRHAMTRTQFGEPIINRGAVKQLISEMAINVEAARLLTYQAAWMVTNGINAIKQCSMAKKFASDISFKAAADAIQILGGYGYLSEYKVERYLREAKRGQIVDGTNQIQDYIIIGQLVKENEAGIEDAGKDR